MKSLRVLLRDVVDYAGLFPPAGLDMAATVANYRDYRRGEHGWALGRIIVPVTRLAEFEAAAGSVLGGELEPWRLSALVGSEVAADLDAIAHFNRRAGAAALIDTIELKVADPAQVREFSRIVPAGLDTFFEVPTAGDPGAIVRTIAAVGRKAKIRTGGVTASAFPPVREVAGFLDLCRREDVAFKATAGLHHPLRAEYRLTYDTDSANATMYGFLNVFLAACFRHAGATADEAEAILQVTSAEEFRFDETGVAWQDHRLGNDGIESARRRFAVSFGSCSFEEPFAELRGLRLI